MNSVTISRTIDASKDDVREAMLDLESFTRAAGFDQVEVDDRIIHVANNIGIAEIELELELVDDPEVDLAYKQRKGIFNEMRTTYTVTPTSDGVTVTATTEFALDVALIGDFLDATVIKRQRTKELNAQLEYLEEIVST